MQGRASTRTLSAAYLKRSSRQKPTEWAWGFRSADPLSWLMAESSLPHPGSYTDRHFDSSFPFISRVPDDVHCSRNTVADPVGSEKQEEDVKETVEAQRVVYVIDDDASMRESLKSLFASVGLRAEVFGSAPEFFEKELP